MALRSGRDAPAEWNGYRDITRKIFSEPFVRSVGRDFWRLFTIALDSRTRYFDENFSEVAEQLTAPDPAPLGLLVRKR
jgi:hypothetical protein